MPITIDSEKITAVLERIRANIGGERRDDFIPRRYPRPIDMPLPGREVESLFHSSGLLIRSDQPVFAYIRDHTTTGISPNPHKRNKVHFSFCGTLYQMKQEDRFQSRYHVTNRVDNQYYVDIPSGYKSKESLEKLYPCQNCLAEVGYKCFHYELPYDKRRQIVESFDAKDAVDLLWQHFEEFRQQTATLRPETAQTGYLPNQRKISNRFRKKKNSLVKVKDAQLHQKG